MSVVFKVELRLLGFVLGAVGSFRVNYFPPLFPSKAKISRGQLLNPCHFSSVQIGMRGRRYYFGRRGLGGRGRVGGIGRRGLGGRGRWLSARDRNKSGM